MSVPFWLTTQETALFAHLDLSLLDVSKARRDLQGFIMDLERGGPSTLPAHQAKFLNKPDALPPWWKVEEEGRRGRRRRVTGS